MLHSWPPCGINQHYQFSTRDNLATTHSILFSWDNVEALPDLHRLELVFRYLPDQDIIAALQQMRGHGRMISPLPPCGGHLASVVFQHESIESLLRELRRNPALLTLCEFDPVPLQSPPLERRWCAQGELY